MSSVDVLKADAKTSFMNIFWRMVEEIMNVLKIMKLMLTLWMTTIMIFNEHTNISCHFTFNPLRFFLETMVLQKFSLK